MKPTKHTLVSPTATQAEVDEAADRVTDAVIGLGAISVLMMTCVTLFVG